MKPATGSEHVASPGRPSHFRRRWGALLLGAQVLWAGALGCSSSEVALPDSAPELLGTRENPLQSTNSLTPNGLTTNGIITNGLITNGIITNGLNNTAFNVWFNENPESYSSLVMKYVVACAVPSGQSRTWTNPVTHTSYTWSGFLGLTPDWASGLPATELEQQLLTACLAAHVNKFGQQVLLSLQGRNAQGAALPTEAGEFNTYSVLEAGFFGNLATGGPAYVCQGSVSLGDSQSSIRACGITSQDTGVSTECAPLVHVGHCLKYCTLDATNAYFTQCTYGGKTYAPLTTRIRPEDVYRCGDGICQISEKCGTRKKYNDCEDCGPCL